MIKCVWILLVSMGFATARDWNFSRDTVYEDVQFTGLPATRVRLTNTGSDTLRMDSVFLDILRPGETQLGVGFNWSPDTVSLNIPFTFHLIQNTAPYLGLPPVPPGQFRDLTQFYVQRCGCPVKRAAEAPSDSLEGRLRFRSRTGETDTLIVFGSEFVQIVVGLRGAPSNRIPGLNAPVRDARGRRVGIPERSARGIGREPNPVFAKP